MMPRELSFLLSTPDETTAQARTLAQVLEPGDIVLLKGDVGAGKTHFARQLIKSILTTDEDVPSPTFTLVQTYETTRGTLWHADLYRIGSTQEIEELGLSEAFDTAICLIEWPDRLAGIYPRNALTLELSMLDTDDARLLKAVWDTENWTQKLAVWQT